MCVSYCSKYIQIELFEKSRLLQKFFEYTKKHFSKQYYLSSSLLILDDGERFKKDYLINWAYHASLQEGKIKLDTLLNKSYLPLRIKILKQNDMLQKINISLQIVGLNKIILILNKENRVAKRYLKCLFGKYCIFETENQIHLNSADESLWEYVIGLVSSRIIHNVAIDFSYEGFGGSAHCFLTQDEYRLSQCYRELESKVSDSFESVKKRYLYLARTYHPDNVYGKDEEIVQFYYDRFRKINEAYEMIKKVSQNNLIEKNI
ncbi:DnaJ domain-containing protein [Helicobacter sp. 11S03491-1]|uniref:J domain-containing protein n=1 Tax=Helicobacter sp. 11S03491-1 TaxID=1476196 RepID=UPI000BA76139|nr:DnaJ domain-containing protein [Helicobacter sp. 11S03491-1]PAF42011.1 hypothetical protein BKH45_05370 [Helicobacter sp. 11S03491-1]